MLYCISLSEKCISWRIYGFQKKCDLVTHLVTYSLTDKDIHRGAPLLKTDCGESGLKRSLRC